MSHVRKREGRYQARWNGSDGKEHGRTFLTRGEALRYGRKMETAKDDGTEITLSKITVTEYARQYAESRPHRATTALRYRSMIDVHLDGSRLGDMRLSAVRHDHVQKW
jgi:hypothetical protein